MDRPRTKAPQTQVYFITHGSGAFSARRLRTVNAGGRASRSIVNKTTAPRSLGVVASLIVSGYIYLAGFVYIAPRPCGVTGSRAPRVDPHPDLGCSVRFVVDHGTFDK